MQRSRRGRRLTARRVFLGDREGTTAARCRSDGCSSRRRGTGALRRQGPGRGPQLCLPGGIRQRSARARALGRGLKSPARAAQGSSAGWRAGISPRQRGRYHSGGPHEAQEAKCRAPSPEQSCPQPRWQQCAAGGRGMRQQRVPPSAGPATAPRKATSGSRGQLCAPSAGGTDARERAWHEATVMVGGWSAGQRHRGRWGAQPGEGDAQGHRGGYGEYGTGAEQLQPQYPISPPNLDIHISKGTVEASSSAGAETPAAPLRDPRRTGSANCRQPPPAAPCPAPASPSLPQPQPGITRAPHHRGSASLGLRITGARHHQGSASLGLSTFPSCREAKRTSPGAQGLPPAASSPA